MREPRLYIVGRALRAIIRGIFAINLLLIALFSVWLVGMILYRIREWLGDHVFSQSW